MQDRSCLNGRHGRRKTTPLTCHHPTPCPCVWAGACRTTLPFQNPNILPLRPPPGSALGSHTAVAELVRRTPTHRTYYPNSRPNLLAASCQDSHAAMAGPRCRRTTSRVCPAHAQVRTQDCRKNLNIIGKISHVHFIGYTPHSSTEDHMKMMAVFDCRACSPIMRPYKASNAWPTLPKAYKYPHKPCGRSRRACLQRNAELLIGRDDQHLPPGRTRK